MKGSRRSFETTFEATDEAIFDLFRDVVNAFLHQKAQHPVAIRDLRLR